MRILITGGFGLIGGRLGQYLCQSGYQVVLGSRNASKPPDWLPQAEVVKTDWRVDHALEQICSGVDVVIHAAGMNAQDCAADPVAALEFNGLTTARLLAVSIRAGVKRFIYLSTAHVYASPLVGIITEDTCPRNQHPYATSHLAGENVVLGATQRGQIEGIVLRLSNAFGAPVHKGVNCWMLLANDLCKQAVQNKKMVLRSSGLQQRDFVAITQVCSVIDHLAYHDIDTLLPGVFNLGSGVSQSVLEMAQLIQQRCKLVLGFEPGLLRPEAEAGERIDTLKYQQSRLAKIGINLNSDSEREIDSLLSFCQASFSHKWNGIA